MLRLPSSQHGKGHLIFLGNVRCNFISPVSDPPNPHDVARLGIFGADSSGVAIFLGVWLARRDVKRGGAATWATARLRCLRPKFGRYIQARPCFRAYNG